MASDGFTEMLSDYASQGIVTSERLIRDTCRLCGCAERAKELSDARIDRKLAKQIKKMKMRDPGAPKCAKTSYMLFCDAERDNVRAKHKDISLGDVSKKLGEMWKVITPERKEQYEAAAAADKQRFSAEKTARDHELEAMKIGDLTGPGTTVGGTAAAVDVPSAAAVSELRPTIYGFSDIMGDVADALFKGYKRLIEETCVACGRPDLVETVRAELLDEKMLRKVWVRKKRDPLAPKHAKSSYQFFCDQMRSQVRTQATASGEELTLGQLSKQLGKLWSELDEKGRKPFAKLAKADKTRFQTEMKGYRASMGSDGGAASDETGAASSSASA